AQTSVATGDDAGSAAAVATEDQGTALRSSCDASRAARAQEAHEMAQAWVVTTERLHKYGALIKRACTIKGLHDPRVSIERDAHGKIVKIKPAGANDYVACKGSLPAAVSQDDARIYWYEQDADFRDRVVLAESPHFNENQKCADVDKAAGFDSQVTYGDVAGVAALARSGSPKR
ncbi:MAG: hypothetical protein ACREJX_08910, partial [Polyangiaceae bacterium]